MNAICGRRGSLGHVVTLRLVRSMKPAEVRHYDRALQSIAYLIDTACDPAISNRVPELGSGVGVADLVKPGETLIAYSDAHPKAGCRMTNCSTAVLVEHYERAASLSEGRRHRKRVDLAFSLYPYIDEHVPGTDRQIELAAIQMRLIEFAAFALNRPAIDDILRIGEGVPALLLACRTGNRGGKTAVVRHHVSRLPGDWLGTAAAAGHA